jgi:hypothetical protein
MLQTTGILRPAKPSDGAPPSASAGNARFNMKAF